MIDTIHIGKIIKKLRIENNLTQEELAEKIDISTNYLSKVERGLSRLNVESFLKMAEVLSFSLEDFGISKYKHTLNKEQEEILKLLLISSHKKVSAYFEVLKIIDKNFPE